MPLNSFIQTINTAIGEPITGAKVYRLAQSIIRVRGTERELIPCLVDDRGEGTYIGIDNTLPVIIYHKSNSIQTTVSRTPGVGDRMGAIVNTYSNSLIVYLNRKKAKIAPDELVLTIQSLFPDTIKLSPYKSIVIRFINVILNSQQVFASEYQNADFELTPDSNLFAINYSIESTFDKKCFEKCQ